MLLNCYFVKKRTWRRCVCCVKSLTSVLWVTLRPLRTLRCVRYVTWKPRFRPTYNFSPKLWKFTVRDTTKAWLLRSRNVTNATTAFILAFWPLRLLRIFLRSLHTLRALRWMETDLYIIGWKPRLTRITYSLWNDIDTEFIIFIWRYRAGDTLGNS